MTATSCILVVASALSFAEPPKVENANDFPKLVGYLWTMSWSEMGNVCALKPTLGGTFLFARHEYWGVNRRGFSAFRHELLRWNAVSNRIECWWFDTDGRSGHDLLTSHDYFVAKAATDGFSDVSKLDFVPADTQRVVNPFETIKELGWQNHEAHSPSWPPAKYPVEKRLAELSLWLGTWDVDVQSPEGFQRTAIVRRQWILHSNFLVETVSPVPEGDDPIAAAREILILGSDGDNKDQVRGWKFCKDGSCGAMTLARDNLKLEGELVTPDGKKSRRVYEVTIISPGCHHFMLRTMTPEGGQETVERQRWTRRDVDERSEKKSSGDQ